MTRVIVTLEVDYVVEVPTDNAPLAVRAVQECWDANWKHFARAAASRPELAGKVVRVRAGEEDRGGRKTT